MSVLIWQLPSSFLKRTIVPAGCLLGCRHWPAGIENKENSYSVDCRPSNESVIFSQIGHGASAIILKTSWFSRSFRSSMTLRTTASLLWTTQDPSLSLPMLSLANCVYDSWTHSRAARRRFPKSDASHVVPAFVKAFELNFVPMTVELIILADKAKKINAVHGTFIMKIIDLKFDIGYMAIAERILLRYSYNGDLEICLQPHDYNMVQLVTSIFWPDNFERSTMQ